MCRKIKNSRKHIENVTFCEIKILKYLKEVSSGDVNDAAEENYPKCSKNTR